MRAIPGRAMSGAARHASAGPGSPARAGGAPDVVMFPGIGLAHPAQCAPDDAGPGSRGTLSILPVSGKVDRIMAQGRVCRMGSCTDTIPIGYEKE